MAAIKHGGRAIQACHPPHTSVVGFAYPCPGCRTTSSLHAGDCDFEGTPWHAIEKAYVDILMLAMDGPIEEAALTRRVPGGWDRLHQAALQRLLRDGRMVQRSTQLALRSAEEFRETVSVPTSDPMRTIYEAGSVPGCHDNAIFALIAWYEMVGLSWEETAENVTDWLRDSGAWGRGGFDETRPEEVVANKRHVYEAGYGWREKAEAAKRVIDARLAADQLD